MPSCNNETKATSDAVEKPCPRFTKLQTMEQFLHDMERYKDNKVMIQQETFILQPSHMVRAKGGKRKDETY